MALDDVYSNMLFFLRWFHIAAGITWIGILYFFNFVNVPFQAVLDKEVKPKVNPALVGRALWWFRWAAMVTFVIGWLLLLYKYGHGHLWYDAEGNLSGRTQWILFGSVCGSIMWFNVWFVIWPAQRQMLTAMKHGQTLADGPALAKRALLFSRTNTFLSAPMLFGMIGPNNYGAFSWSTAVIVTLVGVAVMWGLIKISPKVGQIA